MAIKVGLVDLPSQRKHHSGEVPLLGGVAMGVTFLAVLILSGVPLDGYRVLIGGGLLLIFVGVLDDIHELSATARMVIQISVALLMVTLDGVVSASLGNLLGLGSIEMDAWAIPFTVLAVVGVINAVNMSDGIDGLAGGIVLIAVAFLALVAALSGRTSDLTVLMVLIGVVAGFLIYNFPSRFSNQSKIFMGDSGSTLLGFLVVWFMLSLSQGEGSELRPVTALWILAYPIMDMAAIMIRRKLKGRSLFAPDREHLHHVFLLTGYSSRKTVTTLLLINLLLGSIGIVSQIMGVAEYVMFYAFLLLMLAYLFALRHAWKLMRAIKSDG